MLKTALSISALITLSFSFAQPASAPQKVYGQLFDDVQTSGILQSGYIFANAEPKRNVKAILNDYEKTINNPNIRFSLKYFLDENFILPEPVVMNGFSGPINSETLSSEWSKLFKVAGKQKSGSSLIAMPLPYVIPGGYLQQLQYEDAYFLMLGLLASGNTTMVENMVNNFSYLITQYGFIPKGNRTYLISRSQLPYFALMLDLIAQYQGNKVYALFQNSLQKEYDYWMSPSRTVEMPDGSKLNRFYDSVSLPMDEDYSDNLKWASAIKDARSASAFYRNLRAADEAGWYVSSRWMINNDVSTIQTTSIVPVDLNCFIYHLEATLAKAYKERGDLIRMNYYNQLAEKRKTTIQKYFYNKDLFWYCDYDLQKKSILSKKTFAGFTPLFFQITSNSVAKEVSNVLIKEFLKEGGVQATTEKTGFLFDAPQVFAHHQYIAFHSLQNYELKEPAENIRKRWVSNVATELTKTGKIFGYYSSSGAETTAINGTFRENGYGVTLSVLIKLLKDGELEDETNSRNR